MDTIDLIEAAEKCGERYRARNVAILHVLFNTALRVAEVVSLDVDQIDWDAYVLRHVRCKGGKWLSAHLNDLTAATLERYLADRGKWFGTVTDSALFLSSRGTRLSKRAVQDLLSTLGKQAGIGRPVTPHLLRHSSATELVELGTHITVVKEHCGHASIATTQRYIHVGASARKEAVNALGAQVRRRTEERRCRSKASPGGVPTNDRAK